MQCRFILELLGLRFERGEALPQPGDAGFKLLLVKQAFGVAVDQPGEPLPQLSDLGVERGLRLSRSSSGCPQSAVIFICKALWVGQQRTHFLPHGEI